MALYPIRQDAEIRFETLENLGWREPMTVERTDVLTTSHHPWSLRQGGILMKTNRNQDAIDILDRLRISFRESKSIYSWSDLITQTYQVEFEAYIMLLHAANYLEIQGRI